MKALIVGAGAQGAVIATELVRDSEVAEVRVADLDLEKARKLSARLNSDRVRVHRVDATKLEEIIEAAKGVDIVVNAVGVAGPIYSKICLTVFDAALRSGAHYQDLWSAAREKQMEQDGQWRKAGLAALIDTGFYPGMAQILSAYGASKFDGVDEIIIRHGSRVLREDKEYISTWSPEISWWPSEQPDQITGSKAPEQRYNVYEDGKLKWEDGLEEVYTFPPPIGPQNLRASELESTESEDIPSPRFVKYKRVVSMYPVPQPMDYWRFTRKIGFLSEKPIEVKGVKVAPRDVFISLIPPAPSMEEMEEKYARGLLGETITGISVEVRGEKSGREMKLTLYWQSLNYDEIMRRLPGATCMSYKTSVPASILTKFLGKGKIKNKGVFPPEGIEMETLHEFLVELAKKGMKVHEKVENYIT